MKFTVRGMYRGKKMEVTWEDGKLSGDTLALRLVEVTVRVFKKRGRVIRLRQPRPFGTSFAKDYLTNPLAARALLQGYIFDKVIEMSGEIHEPPPRKCPPLYNDTVQ